METPSVEITVQPEQPAPEPQAPPIVVVEAQPSQPVIDLARESGEQTAELRQLQETVSRLANEIEALRQAPPPVLTMPEPEPEPEPETLPVIPVEVPPPNADLAGPGDQPKRARGVLARLFLGT